MIYPTFEEVNIATHEQLCEWHRFLESPGLSALNMPDEMFDIIMMHELKIQARIKERLHVFGGFTPEISKSIGWIRR